MSKHCKYIVIGMDDDGRVEDAAVCDSQAQARIEAEGFALHTPCGAVVTIYACSIDSVYAGTWTLAQPTDDRTVTPTPE